MCNSSMGTQNMNDFINIISLEKKNSQITNNSDQKTSDVENPKK